MNDEATNAGSTEQAATPTNLGDAVWAFLDSRYTDSPEQPTSVTEQSADDGSSTGEAGTGEAGAGESSAGEGAQQPEVTETPKTRRRRAKKAVPPAPEADSTPAPEADAEPAPKTRRRATRGAQAPRVAETPAIAELPAVETHTPAGEAEPDDDLEQVAAVDAVEDEGEAVEDEVSEGLEPGSEEQPETPALATTMAVLFQPPAPPKRRRAATRPAGPPTPIAEAESPAEPASEAVEEATGETAPNVQGERRRNRRGRGNSRNKTDAGTELRSESSAGEGQEALTDDLLDSGENEPAEREPADSQPAESQPAETDGPEADDESPRRRRRRGGRGRRRRAEDDDSGDDSTDSDTGTGTDGDSEAQGEANGDDRSVDDSSADSSEADSQATAQTTTDVEKDEESTSSSSRRRRRRRRRSGSDDGNDDDPPNTVTRVRSTRRNDEVTGVKGSTRLEAKRQRRREGRETGRRRPIISEAEFLARREAVERTMLVRESDGRRQLVVLEDDVMVEHYVAQKSSSSMIGNIHRGRVQNVLPSMEAAFVDIGKGRNAVLYAGEVNWDAAGLQAGQARRIELALKAGDSVLVQVSKDPIGHKGARLTSQISLPGRYLVYVPGASLTGISRKLPDTERNRLKKILRQVVPEDAGVIVRTAAEGASEDELKRDVERLQRQWAEVEKKAKALNPPALLHGEPDLMIKVVRDVFNEDFKRLIVDGEDTFQTIKDYVDQVAPDLADRVSHWEGEDDLFTHYRVNEQISKGLDRKVWLPSGGSLVIDRTEAMTVVDVNTGKFVGSGGNLEETVTRNNLEAAEEIVRQLRLRDIGGIIVIDFIDMVLESNRDLVLRRLVECLGRDRTKHQVAEVTSLGLVQMTRKRVGAGLLESFSETCEACGGRGVHVQEFAAEPKKTSEPRRHNEAQRVAEAARKAKERAELARSLPAMKLPEEHSPEEHSPEEHSPEEHSPEEGSHQAGNQGEGIEQVSGPGPIDPTDPIAEPTEPAGTMDLEGDSETTVAVEPVAVEPVAVEPVATEVVATEVVVDADVDAEVTTTAVETPDTPEDTPADTQPVSLTDEVENP